MSDPECLWINEKIKDVTAGLDGEGGGFIKGIIICGIGITDWETWISPPGSSQNMVPEQLVRGASLDKLVRQSDHYPLW